MHKSGHRQNISTTSSAWLPTAKMPPLRTLVASQPNTEQNKTQQKSNTQLENSSKNLHFRSLHTWLPNGNTETEKIQENLIYFPCTRVASQLQHVLRNFRETSPFSSVHTRDFPT